METDKKQGDGKADSQGKPAEPNKDQDKTGGGDVLKPDQKQTEPTQAPVIPTTQQKMTEEGKRPAPSTHLEVKGSSK